MKDKKQINKLKTLLLKEGPLDYDDISELKSNPILLIDIGYEYVELGEYEQAFKLFSMGISIDNNDPDILNGLGITLCELGKYEKSRLVLEKAVKLTPQDAITLANLAGVCWEMGDCEKAIYYYNKALEIEPEIEEIYFNLISLYLESDSIYMAYLSCLDMIKVFPENRECKELLDDILLNLAISTY